jgi:AcrR family transcriptional regulator
MSRAVKPDRKTRILDAAENAFADFGFEGASLRNIILDAGVNLATVYYYFKSKEGLMAAVFERRFGPVRQEQMDCLRRLQLASANRRLPVEKILEAMILPPVRLAAVASTRHQTVMRLIGRIVTEPNPQTQELLRRQTADVRAAFQEALQRSLPSIPAIDLRWRVEFVWGALAFVLCNPGKIEKITDGACNPSDTATLMAQMSAFFSAGLRAPRVVSSPRI